MELWRARALEIWSFGEPELWKNVKRGPKKESKKAVIEKRIHQEQRERTAAKKDRGSWKLTLHSAPAYILSYGRAFKSM